MGKPSQIGPEKLTPADVDSEGDTNPGELLKIRNVLFQDPASLGKCKQERKPILEIVDCENTRANRRALAKTIAQVLVDQVLEVLSPE